MKINIKVTKIKNRWHSRLVVNNVLYDEMACSNRTDIGWISREMLRWLDKTSAGNKMSSSARKRQKGQPIGQVWHQSQLTEEKLAKLKIEE